MEPLLLSKSRLNMFCQCPERYRLTYIEGIKPEKIPTAMLELEGSALHHIIENSLLYAKKIPNIAEVASNEFWDKINLADTNYLSKTKFELAKENILVEANSLLEKIGTLKTYQMETYFEHPLVNPLTGEIDKCLILRRYADIIDTPAKNVTRIIDLKTSGKSPSSTQADRSLDLTVYAYLMACKFGFHIKPKTSLLYLVRTKEKKSFG